MTLTITNAAATRAVFRLVHTAAIAQLYSSVLTEQARSCGPGSQPCGPCDAPAYCARPPRCVTAAGGVAEPGCASVPAELQCRRVSGQSRTAEHALSSALV